MAARLRPLPGGNLAHVCDGRLGGSRQQPEPADYEQVREERTTLTQLSAMAAIGMIAPQSWSVVASGPLNTNIVGVGSKRTEIVRVLRQDRTARFCASHDESVDCGPAMGQRAQGGSPAGEAFGDLIDDLAGLEELVRPCVTRWITVQRLDQDRCWNDRRP